MQIFGIILFVVDLLILLAFIYLNFISKRKILTKTIQVAIVFLVNFTMYYRLYFWNMEATGNGTPLLGFASAVGDAVTAFAFRVDVSKFNAVVADTPFIAAPIALGTILAGFMTIVVVINAFRYGVRNSAGTIKANNSQEVNYIIGCGEAEKNYARKHPGTIILLSTSITMEQRNALVHEGFTVCNKLDPEFRAIFSLSKNKSKRYTFVMFTDNHTDEFIYIIKAFKEAEYNDNVYLYLELPYSKTEYFKSTMLTDDKTKTHIILFNRYDNVTNELCAIDPISSYIPKDFFNEDGSVKREKNINVFVIGFGKMNKELYRKLLINNQYVEQDGEIYKSHLVNYHIYDYTPRKELSYLVEGIDGLYKNLEESKDEYFDLPEKMSNTVFHCQDVESAKFMGEVEEICRDKNSMNFFFISYSDDFHNALLTQRLNNLIKNYNYHFYVRVDEEKVIDPNLRKVSYYGKASSYLVYERIASIELYKVGVLVNNAYEGRETTVEDVLRLPFVKTYTNYFQAMNLKHKLNVLGYDLVFKDQVKESDEIIKEEDFLNRLGTINEYKDYFKLSTLTAMIAEEHLHWNAEYLCYGYLPMKKKDHRVIEKKVDGKIKKVLIEQDVPNHVHGCITSYMGLDKRGQYLHDLRVNELNDNTPLFAIEGDSVEVYKYDYQFLKISYRFFENAGFVVIKRR